MDLFFVHFLQCQFKLFRNEWWSSVWTVWKLVSAVCNHKECNIKLILRFPVFKAMFQLNWCWMVEKSKWILFFSHVHIIVSMDGNGSTMTYSCLEALIWWWKKSYVNFFVVNHSGELSLKITFLLDSFQMINAIHKQNSTHQSTHINTIYHKETVVMGWFFDTKHINLSIKITTCVFCLFSLCLLCLLFLFSTKTA
jgi:hypothetical protein